MLAKRLRITACAALVGLAAAYPGALRANDYSADPFDPIVARNAWVMIGQAEVDNRLPQGLLHAMSLVETGQGISGWLMPWPYTVCVNSTGGDEYISQVQAASNLARLKKLGFVRFDVAAGGAIRSNLKFAEAVALIDAHPTATNFYIKPQPYGRRFKNAEEAQMFVYKMFANGHRNMDLGLLQINWRVHGDKLGSVAAAFDPQRNINYAVKYLMEHRQTRDWWASVGRYHSGTAKYARKYILNVWNMYKRVHRLSARA